MDALNEFLTMRVVPFDVPGHKRGKGNRELTDFLGARCLSLDVNSMKPLDNLGHPVSVIRDAEELAADAFGAGHAFFIVNGTTAAVQTMILFAVRRGDKIILPRNVHKSVINALILCGGVPVYVDTHVHDKLHIALGMRTEELKRVIAKNPDARAVLVNNPTYYGICSDLREIVRLAHENGMLALVDEAHGTHLYFGEDLPVCAMAAGADLAAVSMHKSGGSLTQSSFLLCGTGIDPEAVRQTINLTQTTSASYLLLSSLDISRKKLALEGVEIFRHVSEMASYARAEINRIGTYYAYSRELVDGVDICDFDATKLAVATAGTGLSGIEIYDLLRDEYDIQTEFGDTSNVLAYISVGDRRQEIERLVGALSEISRRFRRPAEELPAYPMPRAVVRASPQEAYYAGKVSLPVGDALGRICGEIVMSYPPGIPILAPGEEVTQETIDYIRFAKERGCSLGGTHDPTVANIQVLA
ncbi:MAG: aminotransferase class I/II-fold pyridoxal phosphate-dependent enzyme [Oscillospiraceae bacterium]|jgi:arginine decarboxylase|nr:aminotransferase class I/II-fold pyridoxal phosphate-dependent enzyme [Oscillospiraceae bacterium]